jgi:DNA-binding transcriptional LysR family regulator
MELPGMRDIGKTQIKLSQLRILVAVVDYETFSEAALQLDMSQSAVSHSISSLEETLGVVLFSRGRHGARLTPVGQNIVERARTILQEADGIVHEAEKARGLTGGQVRVASFRSIAVHVLPGAIATFKQQYPDIAVHLSEHDNFRQVEKALREGRADIGFTILPTSHDRRCFGPLVCGRRLPYLPVRRCGHRSSRAGPGSGFGAGDRGGSCRSNPAMR